VGQCGKALDEASRKNPENEPLKRPYEIKALLDEFVISQEDAKRAIAIALYEHARRREIHLSGGTLTIDTDNGPEEVEVEKSNILQLGPSGTGKTHIARSVARMLDLPFFVADATRLTQAGYVGDDVETLLQGLLADANGDLERAQWGILFIDEIDKLARKTGRGATGYRDVTGEGVQQALLKLVEGSKVAVPPGYGKMVVSGGARATMFDTTNVLIIGAGSFAGIEDIVEARINKSSSMGFGGTARKKLSKNAYKQVTTEDIESFGLIPELVGRLPVLTSTYALTEDELVEIMVRPKNSVLKQFQALFGMDDVRLQFEDEALRAIAQIASKRTTGARALRSVVKEVLEPYSFEVPSDPTIQSILITEESVREPGKAKIVREGAAVTA